MKNQIQTNRLQDQSREPWEIRFCLGSYLEQLGFFGKLDRRPENEAFFSSVKDDEAGDIEYIVDGVERRQMEKGPFEARSSFLTKHRSGDKHVQCAAKAGLDSRQNKYH